MQEGKLLIQLHISCLSFNLCHEVCSTKPPANSPWQITTSNHGVCGTCWPSLLQWGGTGQKCEIIVCMCLPASSESSAVVATDSLKNQKQTKEAPPPTKKQNNKTKSKNPNKQKTTPQNKEANKTHPLYLHYFMSLEVTWLPVSLMAIMLSPVRRELVLLPAKITTVMEAAKCCFLTCESICRTKSFVCLFVCLPLCVCLFSPLLEHIRKHPAFVIPFE